MHASIHTYIHTYIHRENGCMHTCICIHACIHSFIHTYIHRENGCTHACIHAWYKQSINYILLLLELLLVHCVNFE